MTGLRPNATRDSFSVSDQISATVDVGTGNLSVATNLLALTGIRQQAKVGLTYNSRDTTGGSGAPSAFTGPSWTWGLDGAGSLSLQPDGSTINFTAGDGSVWPFTPVSGTGSYMSPGGLKAVLSKLSDGTYQLRYLQSWTLVKFDAFGNATSVADRNGNTTTINFASSAATTGTVVPDAGPSGARTETFTYSVGSFGGYPSVSDGLCKR